MINTVSIVLGTMAGVVVFVVLLAGLIWGKK